MLGLIPDYRCFMDPVFSRLTAHQLSLHAGTRTLVESLDLALEPGEVLGILGANGAGKSTLLSACALAGGYLLVLADALARTVIAPHELPVGVLTALLGVPMMLWLLRRP